MVGRPDGPAGDVIREADAAMYRAKERGRRALRAVRRGSRARAIEPRSSSNARSAGPSSVASCESTTSPGPSTCDDSRRLTRTSRRSCAGSTRAGADRARRVHAARRGDGPGRPDRRVRARAGARAQLARWRAVAPGADDVGQRLVAPARGRGARSRSPQHCSGRGRPAAVCLEISETRRRRAPGARCARARTASRRRGDGSRSTTSAPGRRPRQRVRLLPFDVLKIDRELIGPRRSAPGDAA